MGMDMYMDGDMETTDPPSFPPIFFLSFFLAAVVLTMVPRRHILTTSTPYLAVLPLYMACTFTRHNHSRIAWPHTPYS